jgi:O-antigen/teichoic acid export membrane protein
VTPTRATLARALSWVGAGHVFGQACWFGSLLFLAALLPPRAFGTVAVGLLMVTAATRLMEAGTRGTLIIEPRLTRGLLVAAVTRNVAVGLALSAAIALASSPIADAFADGSDPTVIATLGLSVALFAPAIVPLAVLEKELAFRRRSLVQLVATSTAAAVAVAAGLLGAGVWALVLRQLVYQALLALLGWLAVRPLLPAPGGPRAPARSALVRRASFGFLVFSLTDFVVFNADYLAVGHFTDATQLGLYSLAFTIAFAPVTQFSAQLGRVLFPAAAASDPATIRRRTVAGVRLTCLVLVPAVPVGIVLAPVLPVVLGPEWEGIVTPLRILLAVGVAHAIVNVIGESLSGTGHIGFRAKVNAVWMAGMITALLVLVPADGVRGAAVAHLALYVPVAVVYGITGMRLLGAEPRRLGRALRGVSGLFALQAVITFATAALLLGAGAGELLGGVLAATLGLGAGAALAAVRRGEVLGPV